MEDEKESQANSALLNDSDSMDVVENEVETPTQKKYAINPCREKLITKCEECDLLCQPLHKAVGEKRVCYICTSKCLDAFKIKNAEDTTRSSECNLKVKHLLFERDDDIPLVDIKCERRCGECDVDVANSTSSFFWEVMEFCNEVCLEKYQRRKGSHCMVCHGAVDYACLGKYSVRIGNTQRQFCGNNCLQEFKETLKVCSLCQKEITNENSTILATLNQQGAFRFFCTNDCMDKYARLVDKKPLGQPEEVCTVCKKKKKITLQFEYSNQTNLFCGNSCFATFKFVNDIALGKCAFCKNHFDTKILKNHVVYYEKAYHAFCSESCKNIYVVASRKVVACRYCKIHKYAFDMIKCNWKNAELSVCSVRCFDLYKQLHKDSNPGRTKCSNCPNTQTPHNTLIDIERRPFCSYPCLAAFSHKNPTTSESLANANAVFAVSPSVTPGKDDSGVRHKTLLNVDSPIGGNIILKKVMVKKKLPIVKSIKRIIECPISMPLQRNVGTMCATIKYNKAINCIPANADKMIQTDMVADKVLLPIPVPIYVPVPMAQYSLPFPVPLPFPLPIPVPIFIATGCETASAILKEIEDIKKRTPTNPVEAELVWMAEVLANSPQKINKNVLPPKLTEIAEELPKEPVEPFEDLENILYSSPASRMVGLSESVTGCSPNTLQLQSETASTSKRSGGLQRQARKKRKREPEEKVDDPQTSLKCTLGINAWKQWVLSTMAESGKAPPQRKLLKTNILEYTIEELNYGLCRFVKEIRKPNGEEYSPDTIYYLCLCIQTYLFKYGRKDEIFYDSYYEEFTECLNIAAKTFSSLYSNSDFIVTRVREEHLWESRQLGAHCPYVLLNTIMFFNTKYFKLGSADQHNKLSFLRVMRCWRRKFKLTLQITLTADRKSTQPSVIIDEKETDPLVLYEFFLSKCPESAKTRSDSFYLLPERHCTLDSPVWYTTTPLPENSLQKMFHRIRFVKEINVALLCN